MLQTTSYHIMYYPCGIIQLLINTKDKWVYYHQFDRHVYQIGGSEDDSWGSNYALEIPETELEFENKTYLSTVQQCKDQISYYFIPIDMVLDHTRMYSKDFINL